MFICKNCGAVFQKWTGVCLKCNTWNSLEEDNNSEKKNTIKHKVEIVTIKNISLEMDGLRYKTDIGEFDNCLGGGIIKGQAILFAGAPGIGKSTLTLQVIESLSKQNNKILYVAGEESPLQISARAERLKLKLDNIDFIVETEINTLENFIVKHNKKYSIIVVDSIQTLYSKSLTSTVGSVSQISESANALTSLAKGFNISTIIIGHITKGGEIAGPMILEHMVDTVIFLEGERVGDLRILRTIKNRFGSTSETGIFKMTSKGLKEILDTKELLDNQKLDMPGSVYSIITEGTRPIAVEVQALCTKTYFTNPRRTSSGYDLNRLFLLLAIIDKHLKLNTYLYDIYVNITGGLKTTDRGVDLAIIKAIVSSIKNIKVNKNSIYFGEVGLTSEIRKVANEQKRLKESKRLGFQEIIYSGNAKTINDIV